MADKCTWTGQSGVNYTYFIYPNNDKFQSKPGNYIFAYQSSPGLWTAVYIGETSDMSERFNSHHKSGCIQLHGATHIHAHLSADNVNIRRHEENDLIANYFPPCNG